MAAVIGPKILSQLLAAALAPVAADSAVRQYRNGKE